MSDFWTPGVVDTVAGFDAAFCPDPVPVATPGGLKIEWCSVYFGGSSATRRTGWTDAEFARVEHLPRLPVWVPTPGFENPRQSAQAFLAALRAKGVPETQPNGEHTLVNWDLETGREPDAGWLTIAANVLANAGYFNILYGSVSWIFGYPPRSGYHVANYPPPGVPYTPHMYQHSAVAATQYAAEVHVPGGTVDLDLLRKDLLDQLWQPGA